MTFEHNIILKRKRDKPILLDLAYNEERQQQPIVIFCHGYKGFKDWGAWDLLSKYVAGAGYCFVKFNFAYNGCTIEDPQNFNDLEAFGQNNYSQEVKDLEAVMHWCSSKFKDHPAIDSTSFILLGHSRGGGIVLLTASKHQTVKKVITLAGVSDYKVRFGNQSVIEEWRKAGVKYVLNGRTKQQMPHYFQFYEDFIEHEAQLTIKSAVEQLKIPYLIIHGTEDNAVSIEEAHQLHEWNSESTLYLIEGADHVFNTKHPWESTTLPDSFNKAIDKIIQFIK